jgi:hypothetical protein
MKKGEGKKEERGGERRWNRQIERKVKKYGRNARRT